METALELLKDLWPIAAILLVLAFGLIVTSGKRKNN